MSNTTLAPQKTVKELFLNEKTKKRFAELLGNKAQGFVSSVLQIVNDNKLLSKADPQTILNAAATAAILDLPINHNLGFAWIVPYKSKQSGKEVVVAQFQMGWRGYVQLCQRTGQYRNIGAIAIHANQFKSFDQLTEELRGDFCAEGDGNIIGYAAYFKLVNGFEKTVYWTKEKVTKHAKKYSKSFGRANSGWATTFDEMAKKTVLKNALSKWGPMSIEMQTAVLADQSIQKQSGRYDYLDNETPSMSIDQIDHQKEYERILYHINNATDINELNQVKPFVQEYELQDQFNDATRKLTEHASK